MDLKAIKITPKKITLLNELGINNVEALLTHYPYRYEERMVKDFKDWALDEVVYFEGLIIAPARLSRFGYHKSVTRVKVLYQENELEMTLFNRPWLNAFGIDKTISVFGKYQGNNKVLVMSYNSQPLKEQLGIVPIYRVKNGLSQKDLHKYIEKAMSVCGIEQLIPLTLRKKYRLIDEATAIKWIHAPQKNEDIKQAVRCLKYREFLLFQLQLQYSRNENTQVIKQAKQFDEKIIATFINQLPYRLTAGQKAAIDDIFRDLKSTKMMYRLIQGDVGCGKTLVALIGMYACVLSGQQATLMAPTEILAIQHYENIKTLLKDQDIQVDVLYASQSNEQKQAVLAKMQNGTSDIVIGTHALFQDRVDFENLGLVVTDEQHRFGVNQRRKLLNKGQNCDFLLMSATPIPRTLAVSLFADMDVSSIEELPQGRKAIITKVVHENSLRSFMEEMLKRLDEGGQCYIVAPSIENNEYTKIRSVEQLYVNLNQAIGQRYPLGLLHGRLSGEAKEQVMNDFRLGRYKILVTTTVIEVGVDVKNANMMVIYDAQQFGMSQIHQLRGRIGRGNQQGYCWLLSNTKDEQALKRLQILAECHDGFKIASADLALRGPGDLLGERQSGIPGFILGDVLKDSQMLGIVADDAATIVQDFDAYPQLKAIVLKNDFKNYID